MRCASGDYGRLVRAGFNIGYSHGLNCDSASWVDGVSPELGDREPLRLLREGDLDQVAGPIVVAARRALRSAGNRLE